MLQLRQEENTPVEVILNIPQGEQLPQTQAKYLQRSNYNRMLIDQIPKCVDHSKIFDDVKFPPRMELFNKQTSSPGYDDRWLISR